MNKKLLYPRVMLLIAALCMASASIWAQPMVDDDFERGEATARDRKALSWYSLRRPAADTPAAQLEHAEALREAGRLRRAGRAYNALVHRWHQEDEAVEAQRRLAQLLYTRGRYQQAFDEFQYLIDHFAGQFPYDEAIIYQHRIIRHIKRERRWLGGRDPSRALPLLRQVIENGPAHVDVANARLM